MLETAVAGSDVNLEAQVFGCFVDSRTRVSPLLASPYFQLSSAGALTGRVHQALTDRLSLVGEAIYHRAKKISLLQGGFRFATPNWVTTATSARGLGSCVILIWDRLDRASSRGQLIASYAHRLTDKLSLATELFLQPATRDAVVSAGYELRLRQAIVKGMVCIASMTMGESRKCYVYF